MNLEIGDIVVFWGTNENKFNKTKYVIDTIIGDELYVYQLDTGIKDLFLDNTLYKVLGNINNFLGN